MPTLTTQSSTRIDPDSTSTLYRGTKDHQRVAIVDFGGDPRAIEATGVDQAISIPPDTWNFLHFEVYGDPVVLTLDQGLGPAPLVISDQSFVPLGAALQSVSVRLAENSNRATVRLTFAQR